MLDNSSLTTALENLRGKISSHEGFQKVIANIGWLFFDKLLRMTLGLFVVAWVARYLGPDHFGLLNYSIALVGLFLALSRLGFDGIIVRDLVREPGDADVLLGTAFVLKMAGSLLLMAGACGSAILLRPGDPVIWTMAFLVSLGYLLKPFEGIEFFFRAEVRSKFSVIARSIAFVLNALFKVALILGGGGVILFAAATTLESILGTVGIIAAYNIYGRRIRDWRVSSRKGRELLSESWPAFLSTIFAHIYLQVDQVMLGQMTGDAAVGIYSAAVRISTVWYFIPLAVTWSVQAAVVRAKERGDTFYATRLQDLFTSMALAAYAISIPVAILAGPLVNIIFGPGYAGAAPVLSVHIMAALFVFVGVSRGLYIANESLFRFDLLSNIAAAVTNVALNTVLIPKMGVMGAAWATLVSYFVTYVGTSALHPRTRQIFRMQVRALLLVDLVRFLARRSVR